MPRKISGTGLWTQANLKLYSWCVTNYNVTHVHVINLPVQIFPIMLLVLLNKQSVTTHLEHKFMTRQKTGFLFTVRACTEKADKLTQNRGWQGWNIVVLYAKILSLKATTTWWGISASLNRTVYANHHPSYRRRSRVTRCSCVVVQFLRPRLLNIKQEHGQDES